MQCKRLLDLAKSWYVSVREETMAPARMVQFIKQHVDSCPICQEDPDIEDEIVRITEVILPESKIPKAVRMKQEQEEAARREEEAHKADEAAEETNGEDAEEADVEDEEVAPLAPEEEKL